MSLQIEFVMPNAIYDYPVWRQDDCHEINNAAHAGLFFFLFCYSSEDAGDQLVLYLETINFFFFKNRHVFTSIRTRIVQLTVNKKKIFNPLN